MKPIYFDNAATTPVDGAVLEKMLPYFSTVYGNADSLHMFGREAADAVERSRRDIADAFKVLSSEVYFTSGGTEANNLAIKGMAAATDKRRLIISAVEHPSVLEAAKQLEDAGFSVERLPVDSEGVVSPNDLLRLMDDDVFLVSVMLANNETGAVQPIAELSKIAHEFGAAFHTDAVQAVGAVPVDIAALGVDLMSVSAHKLYGPKGAGFLFIRKGLKPTALIAGGKQERGRRGGTTNVSGVVGLCAAAVAALRDLEKNAAHLNTLRERFLVGLEAAVPFFTLNGARSGGHPGIVNVGFMPTESKLLIERLDLDGIACSPGSACASGLPDPSHVLLSMGRQGGDAYGVRFSFGKQNTLSEVDACVAAISQIVSELSETVDLFKRIHTKPDLI